MVHTSAWLHSTAFAGPESRYRPPLAERCNGRCHALARGKPEHLAVRMLNFAPWHGYVPWCVQTKAHLYGYRCPRGRRSCRNTSLTLGSCDLFLVLLFIGVVIFRMTQLILIVYLKLLGS